jgi:hypothetical protein
MTIDRDRLVRIFDQLGEKLATPATICVIGSSPAIIMGQPDRMSQGIDVWRQRSDYDETQFRRACEELGPLFDPKGEIDPKATYVQIIQPGSALTVVMPQPALLASAKLVRGDPRDIGDVAWWSKERALGLDEIKAAIGSLLDQSQREAAGENIILVGLVARS